MSLLFCPISIALPCRHRRLKKDHGETDANCRLLRVGRFIHLPSARLFLLTSNKINISRRYISLHHLASFLPPLYINCIRSPPPSAQPNSNSLLTSRSNYEPSSFRSPPRHLVGGFRGRHRAAAGVAPGRVTGAGPRGRPERGGGLRVPRKTGEKDLKGRLYLPARMGAKDPLLLRFNATLPPKNGWISFDFACNNIPSSPDPRRSLPIIHHNSSSYSNREITPTVIQGL